LVLVNELVVVAKGHPGSSYIETLLLELPNLADLRVGTFKLKKAQLQRFNKSIPEKLQVLWLDSLSTLPVRRPSLFRSLISLRIESSWSHSELREIFEVSHTKTEPAFWKVEI